MDLEAQRKFSFAASESKWLNSRTDWSPLSLPTTWPRNSKICIRGCPFSHGIWNSEIYCSLLTPFDTKTQHFWGDPKAIPFPFPSISEHCPIFLMFQREEGRLKTEFTFIHSGSIFNFKGPLGSVFQNASCLHLLSDSDSQRIQFPSPFLSLIYHAKWILTLTGGYPAIFFF